MDNQERVTLPPRFRLALRDAVTDGATILDLPSRRVWPANLIVAVMFAIFAGVELIVITQMWSGRAVRDVFDLMFLLFQGFWVLGWSVGVLILGLLAVLLCFYGESARLQHGRLVYVPRLGPLKIIVEYDLAQVRNVRIENAGGDDKVRVRFDSDQGSTTLGDSMPRADAERLVRPIQAAVGDAGSERTRPTYTMETTRSTCTTETTRPTYTMETTRPTYTSDTTDLAAPSLASASGLALLAANLAPLAGVMFFGWNLANVMVLFWAESAVIGFYSALKMAIVGKVAAVFTVPFFVGHFGGFMAGHFLFIYAFFVRGLQATGPAPGVREALLGTFMPVWPSLAALFISHGISFFTNFIGRREYAGATMKDLMTAPYNRIIAMHLAIIFGGWVIMLLKSPVPALALLVVLKTAIDFAAHRKEHRPRPDPAAISS